MLKEKKKIGYIRCNNDLAQIMPEEFQIAISTTGSQIMLDIVNGQLPGVIVYALPEDDGTKSIYVDTFNNLQDTVRAASFAALQNREHINKMLKKFKVDRKTKE